MKKITLLSLFIAVSFSVFSQRVIVFNNNDTIKKQMRYDGGDKNAISWNITAVARGAFLWEYERKINDYLHVMGGAGVTLVDLYSELFRHIKYETSSIFDFGSSLSAGFMGEVALKVFPKQSDDMDGFYLAPLYRFRNYNSSLKLDGNKYKQTSNYHDAALIIGWQGTTYNDFFYNTFAGFGCGFGFHKNYEHDSANYGSGEPIGVKPVSSKSTLFFPLIGMTIGWVF